MFSRRRSLRRCRRSEGDSSANFRAARRSIFPSCSPNSGIRDCSGDGLTVKSRRMFFSFEARMTSGSFMRSTMRGFCKDSLNSGILEKTQHRLLIACHLSDLKHEFVKVGRKSIRPTRENARRSRVRAIPLAPGARLSPSPGQGEVCPAGSRPADSASVPRLRTIEKPPQRMASPSKKPKRAPPAPQRIRNKPEP